MQDLKKKTISRLKALLVINSLAVTSAILSISSASLKMIAPFLIARFLNGLMCGMFGCVATIYLTEIAPRSLRGAAGTMHHLASAIGILATNVCGLSTVLGSTHLWPYLFALTLIPAAIHILFLQFCVETPKYVYINRNDPVEAKRSITFYFKS